MIKANHKPFHVWLSAHYSLFFLKIFFRNIRYVGADLPDKNLPVLMIANHFSWWDGFIQVVLNKMVYQKKFHFMMLEDKLKKAMILNKMGATSIVKGSRSSIESLQYLVEILKDPGNLFLFFPQGEIKSIYTFPLAFEKGALGYILKKTKNDFQLVFNVNLIDYGEFKRPELTLYYKTYKIPEGSTAEDIELEFNNFAKTCLDQQRSA